MMLRLIYLLLLTLLIHLQPSARRRHTWASLSGRIKPDNIYVMYEEGNVH